MMETEKGANRDGEPGGLSGAARNQHYAATKGGMISMIYAMAVELARFNITVNAILPGWIERDD